MTSQCPNEFPSTSAAYRIALCGESPGEREQALHRPFVGAAGAHLDRYLAGAGILRSACFVGNVAQIRPPGNDFNSFDWRGPEVQDGIAALLADLDRFAPYLVVTLGNVPLHLFRAGNVAPPWTMRAGKRVFNWPYKVTTWRGSLFAASPNIWRTDTRWTPAELALATGATTTITPALPAAVDAAGEGGTNAPPSTNMERGAAALPLRPAWKCLSTLHPAYCLRAWSENFNLRQDLRRARAEGESAALVLPTLDFDYGP